MAEGGGFENPAYDPDDPEVPDYDDDDNEDEQDHDETHPFWLGSASTPYQGQVVKKSRCKQCIMKRADFQTHLTMKSLR